MSYLFYAFLIVAAIVAGYLGVISSVVVIAIFSAIVGHSVGTIQTSLTPTSVPATLTVPSTPPQDTQEAAK